MKSRQYPIGPSSYFEGSILKLNEIFGIVLSKVTAPDDLYAPILLTKDSKGKIIAPTGS
jgi:hypothetical protein